MKKLKNSMIFSLWWIWNDQLYPEEPGTVLILWNQTQCPVLRYSWSQAILPYLHTENDSGGSTKKVYFSRSWSRKIYFEFLKITSTLPAIFLKLYPTFLDCYFHEFCFHQRIKWISWQAKAWVLISGWHGGLINKHL